MSFKTLLHLDSIDGNQNYDPILKNYHFYNTTVLIYKNISNIKEILLKSFEFPLFLIIIDIVIIAIYLISFHIFKL